MTQPPLEHIIRSEVPWRREQTTECGRDASDVVKIVTREQMLSRWRREGNARAAYTSCMTCIEAARRNQTWEDNPCAVILRSYPPAWGRRDNEQQEPRKRELIAIAMLIEAHRDEFDEAVQGLSGAASLDAHRRTRRASGKPL